jgi:hypothetical protein
MDESPRTLKAVRVKIKSKDQRSVWSLFAKHDRKTLKMPLVEFIRRHKILFGALLIAIAALATFIIVNINRSPTASGVAVSECIRGDGDECVRFPSVTGTNLLDETLNLPDDFDGLTLVVVSFDEGQTSETIAWLPLAQELAAEYPRFSYYNIPVLNEVAPLMRAFISRGMMLVVPSDHHAITIMLFLEDKQLFLDALLIPDVDEPQSFLLNDAGEVIWRMRGGYSDESGASLRAAVEACASVCADS